MDNKKILELCDEKIKLSKELEEWLTEDDLEKVRRLIQIEKEIQRYICKQEDEVEVIWN